MEMESDLKAIISEHVSLTQTIPKKHLSDILTVVRWAIEAFSNGNKIVFAGNGGSAADAQHLAAEFIGRFEQNRRSLPAIALTTDSSVLTAVSNDFGFDTVFARQVEGLMHPGDIFYAISTSGNSENVVQAVEACRNIPCRTVGLLGRNGGKLKDMVDLALIIESNNTARVQEIHEIIGHIICFLVEKEIFSNHSY